MPPAIGTVCWFAFDNPGLSARIPIYAGVTTLPPSFAICGQWRYRMDSAAWIFRRTNRLATVKWGAAEKIMADNVAAFEKKALLEMPLVEKTYLEILAIQDAREAALHPGRVSDQVLQRLRPCRHEQVHRAGRPVHVPAARRLVSRAAAPTDATGPAFRRRETGRSFFYHGPISGRPEWFGILRRSPRRTPGRHPRNGASNLSRLEVSSRGQYRSMP